MLSHPHYVNPETNNDNTHTTFFFFLRKLKQQSTIGRKMKKNHFESAKNVHSVLPSEICWADKWQMIVGGGYKFWQQQYVWIFQKKGKQKWKRETRNGLKNVTTIGDNFCFFVFSSDYKRNNIARKIITTKDFGVYTQIPAAQQQQQLFIYLCI